MVENRKRVTRIAVPGKADRPGRSARQNGQKPSTRLLSWYAAQPAERGLTCALTSNGYVIL